MSNVSDQQVTRLHEHHWFETEQQQKLWSQRVDMGWPTPLAPFSCLVAAMGNHWQPGCFDAVKAMCQYAFDQGYQVTLYEEHDRCYQPYDALGLMRNMAYMRAIREGYEYVCYVDNDVNPPVDALVNLLRRFVPVCCPIVRYADGGDHGLSMPRMESGKGLALVTNCTLTMVLFQTAVFLPWALTPFWESPLGADEAYHFQRLAMAGHRPFVDTDVVVTAMTPPHFPLDSVRQRSAADLALEWVRANGRD